MDTEHETAFDCGAWEIGHESFVIELVNGSLCCIIFCCVASFFAVDTEHEIELVVKFELLSQCFACIAEKTKQNMTIHSRTTRWEK